MITIKEASLFCKDGDWIESKDQSPSGIRLIQTGNIGIGTYLDKFIRAKYISEETFDRMECTEVFSGDIIISRLPAPVGRACIVPDGLGRTIAAVDCTILRIDEKKFLKEYILLYSETEQYKAQIEKFLAGSTRVRISRKNLESISIPQKNLETQKSIVSRIYKIKNIIDLRKQQLFKLDQLVKSRFVEMFGDTKNNINNFRIYSIGDICSLKSGTSLPLNVENEGGDIPYIKVSDMSLPGNERYITISSRYVTEKTAGKGIFPIGSVIFPKRGGAIGTNKKRLTQIPICADLNIMGVIPGTNITPYYLLSYFDMIDLGKLNNGSSVPQLNNKDIAPLKFLLPPFSLQEQFATFVQQVDKAKSSVKQSLEKLETLKKSLMQEYFG